MNLEGAQGMRTLAIFYSHLFFCNHFEELQTVLFEVELIINNAPLTYVYPDTIKICCQSFVVWQIVIILFYHNISCSEESNRSLKHY